MPLAGQPKPPHTYLRNFMYTLATKRGTGSGTRRGVPIANLSDIRCSPVFPFDSTQQLESSARGVSADFYLYCDPADIRQEDIVEVNDDGVEYSIVEVAKWPTTEPRVMELRIREYQSG